MNVVKVLSQIAFAVVFVATCWLLWTLDEQFIFWWVFLVAVAGLSALCMACYEIGERCRERRP